MLCTVCPAEIAITKLNTKRQRSKGIRLTTDKKHEEIDSVERETRQMN